MWTRRALGVLLGLTARAWLATLRLTLILDPALDATANTMRPWSLAFWHGQQFALLRWRRRRGTVALVSLSRDGEIQAAALPRVGMAIERGSSSRGGVAGLKAIVRRLRREGLDAAFAVDGPKGPRGVVRSESGSVGAAIAARLSGGVVVPMASACGRLRVLTRTWDRFELPLPFSRVVVVLGAPLAPEQATPDRLAAAIDAARAIAVDTLAEARALPAARKAA
jgi:lysophospholipid acyltransferase (LPLAT)-like uncharacterized protein